MKKVLFFAAVLAVASMTFVACGKKENKENKETEQEGVEQNEEFAGEEANEATYAAEPENFEAEEAEEFEAPAADVDRAEAATRAIEAATSMEEVMAVAIEYQDLTDDDFTPAQQARMQAAVAKLQ